MAPKLDKSFLILDIAKSFCNELDPLLTKLVLSRWLDVGLVLCEKGTRPISSYLDLKLG